MSLRDWRVLLGLAVLIAILIPSLVRTFPSGGDPGHMLGIARGAEEPAYPPLVPALLVPVHGLTGWNIQLELLSMKVFGGLAMLSYAVSLAFLTRKILGRDDAAYYAFLFSCVNTLAIYQLLWGGLAQFVGMALGLAACAFAFGRSPRSRVLAVALLVLTAYAHWYTLAFVSVAFSTIWLYRLRAGNQGSVRETAVLAFAAFVATLPAMLLYAKIAKGMRSSGPLLLSGHGLGSISTPALIGGIVLIITLSAAVALGVRVASQSGWDAAALKLWVMAGLGGVLILVLLTPSQFAGRIFYFLPLVAIPCAAAVAVVLSGEASLIFGEARMNLRTQGLVPILAVVLGASGVWETVYAAEWFNPLDEDALEAFQAIGKDSEVSRTAVFSTFANIDGWWLEAVSGKPAVQASPAKFLSLEREEREARFSQLARAGEIVFSSGKLYVALSPERGLPQPVVVVLDVAGDTVPFMGLNETESWALLNDGTRVRLRPEDVRGAFTQWDGSLVEIWENRAGAVRREIRTTGEAVEVRYYIPGAQSIELQVSSIEDGYVWDEGRLTVRQVDGSIRAVVAISPDVVLGDMGGQITLEADEALRFVGVGAGPFARFGTAQEALDQLGVDTVYVRGLEETSRQRWMMDPRMRPVFENGVVGVWTLK